MWKNIRNLGCLDNERYEIIESEVEDRASNFLNNMSPNNYGILNLHLFASPKFRFEFFLGNFPFCSMQLTSIRICRPL